MNNKMIYIVLFFIMTASLFVLMPFYHSNMNVEKREAAAFPSLKDDDGSINMEFFDEMTDYFNDNFAFRQELATYDALYKSYLFHSSNTSKVIIGSDDYLFFGGMINDYTGRDLMNERDLFCACRMLYLVNEYVSANGGHFVFTIVPNKNTLYPEFMPDRYIRTDRATNLDNLVSRLDGIDYLDLYSVLSSYDEVLYHKWDSHWNNMGASIAYRALMQHIGLPFIDYSNEPYTITADHRGDLYDLIFPASDNMDENVTYERSHVYEYRNPVTSTEDLLIVTSSSEGQSSMLMFRDSFGNALIAFVADSIGNATFSKGVPYNLDYVRSLTPEYVVIEIVERNLPDLIVGTPTMDAPLRPSDTVESAVPTVSDSVSITVEDKDTRYFITGTVDPDLTDDDSPVYIRVNTPDGPLVYEAFAQSEYSFGLYISKIQFFSIEVITSSNDILYSVST